MGSQDSAASSRARDIECCGSFPGVPMLVGVLEEGWVWTEGWEEMEVEEEVEAEGWSSWG